MGHRLRRHRAPAARPGRREGGAAAARAFAAARRDARRRPRAGRRRGAARAAPSRPARSRSARGPRARSRARRARRMGLKDDFVGTEHLLLALLIERDSRTANVLTLARLPARTCCARRCSRSARRSPPSRPRPASPPRSPTAAREVAAERGASTPDAGDLMLALADRSAARRARSPSSASRRRRCARRDRASTARLVTRAGREVPTGCRPAPISRCPRRAPGEPSSWAPGRSGPRSRCCSPAAASAPRCRRARASSASGSRPTRENADYLPGVELPRELRIEPADERPRPRPTTSSSACPRWRSAR